MAFEGSKDPGHRRSWGARSMLTAHILVCHSVSPRKLFESVPRRPEHLWYVFLHGNDDRLNDEIIALTREREGAIFDYRSNRGLARSWNEGISASLRQGCEAILLLNDDLHFREGGHQTYLAEAGSIVAADDDVSWISVRGLESGASGYAGHVLDQGFSCCYLPERTIARVGYFDQNFSPAYFEDCDYARRCNLLDLRHPLIEQNLVEHERASTVRTFDAEQRKAFDVFFANNRAYYERKWGGYADHERYVTPFGSDFNLRIAFEDRDRPYGPAHDRDLAADGL